MPKTWYPFGNYSIERRAKSAIVWQQGWDSLDFGWIISCNLTSFAARFRCLSKDYKYKGTYSDQRQWIKRILPASPANDELSSASRSIKPFRSVNRRHPPKSFCVRPLRALLVHNSVFLLSQANKRSLHGPPLFPLFGPLRLFIFPVKHL